MHGRSSRDVLRHLRTLYAFGVIGDLTDEQLLQCFVTRDQAAEEAFAILVERHGTMVLGVCLRVLGNNAHEAEDAFQATFLVLARKASTISRGEKLASWLYGAALRTASESRRRNARRRTHEERVSVPISVDRPDEVFSKELRTILDEELARLPAAHRVAVILCELEGLSRSEAARRLDIPEGTLSSRLARAKNQLRDRLTRRGLAISTLSLSSALIRQSHAISVPLSLIESTIAGATQLATSTSLAAGVMTVSVATLTEGVLQAMFVTKLKAGVMGFGTLAAVVSGAMVLGQSSQPKPFHTPVTEKVTAIGPAPAPAAPAPNPFDRPPAPVPVSALNPSGRPGPARIGGGDLLAPAGIDYPGSSFVPKPANAPKIVPAPSPVPAPDDRTAALEKKLDRILNALDRMASPSPNLTQVVPQVESAPQGRIAVEMAKTASLMNERLSNPDPGPSDLLEESQAAAPPPAATDAKPVPAVPFTRNSPAPMTSRLDMLEKNLQRASHRMARLEDRMAALEKLVGITTVHSVADTTTPRPDDTINELEPLPQQKAKTTAD